MLTANIRFDILSYMSANRFIVCEICGEEVQVRSTMAYQTYYNHMKKHDEKTKKV